MPETKPFSSFLPVLLIPVGRDRSADEGFDFADALVTGDFIRLLAQPPGLHLKAVVKVELIAPLIIVHGLGPELVDFVLPHVEHVLHRKVITPAVDVHGEEPPVAGIALQEIPLIGGGPEHALARKFGRLAGVCRTELVLFRSDEVLESLVGRLPHRNKFSKFDEPLALHLFHRRLVPDVTRGERIAVPLHPELADDRGLAYALRPGQGQRIIVLASGTHHPRHGGYHVDVRHGLDKRRIVGVEVVDEHPVQPLLSVPFKAVEIVPDGVVRRLLDREVMGVEDRGLAGDLVSHRHIPQQALVIVVTPDVPRVDLAPRKVAGDLGPVGELVIPDGVLQGGIVLADEVAVEGVADDGIFHQAQIGLP